MKKEPIIVAQIMGKWVGGGVEAVIMNYYRHIDRNKIQFDFICDSDSTDIPYEEIEKLGGRVILVPPYQKLFKYIKELKRVFKENNYKIVHSNINALSVFPLYAAKKAGVPVRIAHSHSTSNKKEWKKTLIKNILRPFSKKYANEYFACTEHAGRWLFGNKTFDNGKVTIINNAIDLEKFKYNEKTRNDKRKELNIKKSTMVIGHIGRFVAQKNHTFLIDIFAEYHKQNNDSLLLLIGQGPLQDEIKKKVKDLNLDDSVQFLGQRKDVSELYQAMDIFMLPSLYEGLGMVLIEAQAAGLPCIASTEVPKIAKVTDLVQFENLDDDKKEWISLFVSQKEKNDRNNKINQISNNGYDIKIESKKIEKVYSMLLKKGN